MTDPTQLDLLAAANTRLVRTVDALDDSIFSTPSLLPDWTVGHVVAHLALNGEALAGALGGVASGVGQPMYASQETRDGDITELAVASPSDLRARLMASTELFDREVADLPEDKWETVIDRTPGKPAFSARSTVLMRIREVEIHHADLGVGYTAADWSPAFSTLVLDSMRKRDWPVTFRVLARDLAQTWSYGDGDPASTVTGSSSDLAWWLTGRGDGGSLTSDSGELPEVSPVVTYDGNVTAGGPAQVRQAGCVTITKVAVDPKMSNNAYLLHCEETQELVLIDAAYDAKTLLDLIGDRSLTAVVTTHQHWDHHRALAEVVSATGASVVAGAPDADAITEQTGVAVDRTVAHGDRIAVGTCDLTVIALAGHTPGSIALFWEDGDGQGHLFTGDSLFPGGVGNTFGDAAAFTSLIDEVSTKIFDVYGDDVWFYPGHGGDSTLGAERPHLDEWRERGW